MNRTIEAVEQRRATIHRLHGEGRRPVEIARLAGCSLSTVCRALASPSVQDRRRLNGRRPPDRLAGELGLGADAAELVDDPYAGIGVEDYGVVATAGPDSLVPEVTLLRAYIRATARQVVAAAGDERRQAQLMFRTGRMVDVLARVFRAARRGERGEDLRLQALGDAAEWVLSQRGDGWVGVGGKPAPVSSRWARGDAIQAGSGSRSVFQPSTFNPSWPASARCRPG
jgi:hypothetical protein